MFLNYYCYTVLALALWLRYATYAGTAERRWREKRQALATVGTTLSPFASLGSCPPLASVQNGIVNYLPVGTAQNSLIGTAQPAGTTALLTCAVGFFPLGASSAQCLSNSQWSTSLGTCQPLSSSSGTGAVGVSGATPFPQTTGANAVGGPTTVSSSTVGNCLPMLAPLGGQLTYSTASQQQQNILGSTSTYSQGTVVQLYCTNGGTVSGGASQAVCQLGQWQPFSLGQCLGTVGLNGGITSLPQQQMGVISTGTTPAFGTTPIGTNFGAVGCLPAVATAAFGTVQYSQQPMPSSTLGSGLTIGTTVYPSGTTALLQCQQGLPSGAQSSVCSNGIWTPPLGMCSGATTPTTIGGPQLGTTGTPQGNSCLFGQMAPLGASIQYSSGGTAGPFPSGTIAQVICQQQQGAPQGQSTSVCTNGQWQPPFLTGCSAQSGIASGINSGLIGPINSGTNTMSGGLNLLGIGTQCLFGMAPVFGATVVYSSAGPPYAQGTTANLQCANGQWPIATTPAPLGGLTTSTTPSGIGTVSATTATCIGGQWQPANFGTLQCPGGGAAATAPAVFGQTTFPSSSSSSFSSSTGFGTTPLVPQQQQQQCLLGIGGLAFNGQIQYSNRAPLGPYPAGTTATLTCNSGFVPSGQTVATCQNGQFVPATLGQCVQSNADATPYTMASTATKRNASPPTVASSSTSTATTRANSTSNNSNGSSSYSAASAIAGAGAFVINGTGVDTRDCFELPQPLNGRFVYSPMGLGSPYPIGATVTLVCANGTQLQDGSTVGRSAVCHSGGWAMLTLLNGTCMPSTTAAAAAAAAAAADENFTFN